MNYHIFREIADSWVLLLMVLFFIGAVVWAFRPKARRVHEDAGSIPFRHEHTPGGRS
jgi:cytochrome c oxidase cbb3-type subunit IV